jgi:hypothetical protein
MATLTASAAAAPAKVNINGAIGRVVAYSTPAAGYSAGDVIQICNIPKGACILDMRLTTDLFGTSNATIGSIGDGNTATRYFGTASTSSSLAVALIMNNQAIGYTYTADDTIDVTIGTVTSASSVGVIKLAITYTMDNP